MAYENSGLAAEVSVSDQLANRYDIVTSFIQELFELTLLDKAVSNPCIFAIKVLCHVYVYVYVFSVGHAMNWDTFTSNVQK